MKRALLLATFAAMVLAPPLFSQSALLSIDPVSAGQKQEGRSITGQVLDKSDAPIPEAVVYLKNKKTLVVKSFIAEKDGAYRFHGLSPNVDYELYADFNGQHSSVKTISSFDTRSNITLNLHVEK